MRKMLLLLAMAVATVAAAQTTATPAPKAALPTLSAQQLRPCDLLFVVNGRGNAITASTEGVGELPIDHVGVTLVTDSGVSVSEAIPSKGVTRTPLAAFLRRAEEGGAGSAVLVGRVQQVGVQATEATLASIRAPYDSLYLPGLEAVYCSELVQTAFVDSTGRHVFSTIPMSFHDRNGRILPEWTAFYARHGMAVPEGQPGTNPGQLSRDAAVTILGWLDMNTDKNQNDRYDNPKQQ